MPPEAEVRIELQFALGSYPLTGHLTSPTGARLDFCGWTALAVALEQAIDEASRLNSAQSARLAR